MTISGTTFHSLAEEQFFPLQSYRVGPYAAGGTGFFGGFIDYLNLINIRDGGVNGVKLSWRKARRNMRWSAASKFMSG
jgi:branched-chain amino acid transport system substrate-binding protein